jgi:hypothetical protein
MGTNFYWAAITKPAEASVTFADGELQQIHIPSEGKHIGKRSAAGMYCYDCDMTLCPGGREKVHMGRITDPPWPENCPKCGKGRTTPPNLTSGPAAVELGFAKPEVTRPKGVAGCSSFSWAIEPGEVRNICETRGNETTVVDEYGRTLTGKEFLGMLRANCPIEYTDSIGHEFS